MRVAPGRQAAALAAATFVGALLALTPVPVEARGLGSLSSLLSGHGSGRFALPTPQPAPPPAAAPAPAAAPLPELRFGLPALTRREAAAAPALDLFDFSRPAFATPPLPAAPVDPQQAARCRQAPSSGT
jgi:hypothetical protein